MTKSVNIVVSQVLWGSPSLDHLVFYRKEGNQQCKTSARAKIETNTKV